MMMIRVVFDILFPPSRILGQVGQVVPHHRTKARKPESAG